MHQAGEEDLLLIGCGQAGRFGGEHSRISDDAGMKVEFEIDDFRRQCLLEGLDDIALTLMHESKIADFEQSRAKSLSEHRN